MAGRLEIEFARTSVRSKCLKFAAALALFAVPSLLTAAPAPPARNNLLEFRCQIILPESERSPRKRIFVTLFSVESSFSGRTHADLNGRFRFHRLQPGSYTLSIFIPNEGQILETLDITKSFSNKKGVVEKKLEFDEKSLHARMRPIPQDTVSVRSLSIPAKAKSEYEKAQRRLQHHDADGALEHLNKAVALAPQFAEAFNYLGTIYFQTRQYQRAEESFRQALAKDPQAFEPLVNLGGVLLAQGRPEDALAINLHAQKVQPKDALANAQLGLSYFLLGDYEHALNYLRLTEQIDPAHFSNPEIPLAEIYLLQSDKAAALRELQGFLKVHPDSAQAEGVQKMIEKIRTGDIEHSRPAVSIAPPPS